MYFRLPFALVVLALASTGSGLVAQNAGAPQPAVIVATAQQQALAYQEAYTGRVTAVQRIDLRARVSGFITAVDFGEGQSVSKGTVLFEIEPDAYEAAVTQVEGQITSAEAEKKLADIDLARQRELVERQAAAETTAQQAEANLGSVIGKLQQLQGALQQAQLDLSYTNVIAPFDGRVGFTDIDIGAFVGPDSGVLASLSSIDPIYVTFAAPEATLIDIRKRLQATPDNLQGVSGENFEVRLTLANGDAFDGQGKVAAVDSEVQTGTDTIEIRAQFDNPNGLLRDGQLVSVELVEDTNDMALTIPVKSLQRDQAGYFVLTVDDSGKVAKTPIDVSRVSGMQAAIASGLTEGQKVVTDGQQKVRPGMTVTVKDAEPALGETPATQPAAAKSATE